MSLLPEIIPKQQTNVLNASMCVSITIWLSSEGMNKKYIERFQIDCIDTMLNLVGLDFSVYQ